MVYALNVFNFIDGKEDDYREYSVKAGKIIYGKGGRVVSSGWNPIRKLHGDRERKYMIVVEFPNKKIFSRSWILILIFIFGGKFIICQL